MNIQIHLCIQEAIIDKNQNAQPTLFIVLMQDAIKIIEIKKTVLVHNDEKEGQ